jgi:hypothetical protein
MNIHFALSCDLWKLFTLSSVLKRDFFNLLSFAFVILSIKKKKQNDGSSRTMAALLDNGYLSLTGQSQPLSEYPQGQQQRSHDHRSLLHTRNYQQGQQLSQDYGAPFHHANAYHSQAGIRPEQPRQSLSDLSSSQGPAPEQLQHLWQQSYLSSN